MHTVLDIDRWATEVAEREAVALREDVHAVLSAGGGLAPALALVRRRLGSLTPAQREIAIQAISPPAR